jgi:dynein heavy chain
MIKNNPDVEPLIKEASEWEHTMVYTQDIIEIWLRVQTNYLFLVPIFAGGIQDEVKSLLDHEGFKQIDKSWREIMNKLRSKSRVLDLEKEFPSLAEELKFQDLRLATIHRNLEGYLSSKREYFPRFYFLPNEDLIEILGDSQKPERIQKHLKKCFEGIYEVGFRDAIYLDGQAKQQHEQIYSIKSKEGEQVPLVSPIFPHVFEGQVEKWLFLLEQ